MMIYPDLTHWCSVEPVSVKVKYETIWFKTKQSSDTTVSFNYSISQFTAAIMLRMETNA